MANTISTNVPSTVANYFADEFQALMQSGGVAPPTAYTPPPSQSLTDFKAANANKQFFLSPQGSSYRLDSVTQGEPTPESAVLVDMNVAYGISSAQFSLTDWLMNRLGNEIRDQLNAQTFGPLLTTPPENTMSFDMSTLDAADLYRLLKLLASLSEQGQTETRVGAIVDGESQSALYQLGLSQGTLTEALELQAGFTADPAKPFDTIVKNALDLLARQSQEAVTAASLDYELSGAAELGSTTDSYTDTLSTLVNTSYLALTQRLQAAADLTLLSNPAVALFGSDLEFQQDTQGYVLQTPAAAAREAARAAVKAALAKALDNPALKTAMADAMAANADALGTANLPLPRQTALYNDVAGAVMQAMQADAEVLDGMARDAVELQSAIRQMVSNELVAATLQEANRATGIA